MKSLSQYIKESLNESFRPDQGYTKAWKKYSKMVDADYDKFLTWLDEPAVKNAKVKNEEAKKRFLEFLRTEECRDIVRAMTYQCMVDDIEDGEYEEDEVGGPDWGGTAVFNVLSMGIFDTDGEIISPFMEANEDIDEEDLDDAATEVLFALQKKHKELK